MNLVIDASALCEFFLGNQRAVEVLDPPQTERRVAAHVPELLDLETIHTLRGLERGGKITSSTAERTIGRLARFPLVRHRHASLRRRIWTHRHNLTAYDATYLALSEIVHRAVLVTADTALASYAETVLGADRVRRV